MPGGAAATRTWPAPQRRSRGLHRPTGATRSRALRAVPVGKEPCPYGTEIGHHDACQEDGSTEICSMHVEPERDQDPPGDEFEGAGREQAALVGAVAVTVLGR